MTKFVKGQIPWNKGKPCSEEVKAKISLKNKGHKHTPEIEAKVTLNLLTHGKSTRFAKGLTPWNKGKSYSLYTKAELDAHQKEWRQKNKVILNEKNKAWRKANPEKQKEYAKKSRINNAGRVNANNAKRHASKLKRTPQWLTKDDLWLIKEAYNLAQIRSKHFGFKWHVDHIIPLQGDIVSGLHVPTNLQVIEGKLNIMKNNKFEGELFCPL